MPVPFFSLADEQVTACHQRYVAHQSNVQLRALNKLVDNVKAARAEVNIEIINLALCMHVNKVSNEAGRASDRCRRASWRYNARSQADQRVSVVGVNRIHHYEKS